MQALAVQLGNRLNGSVIINLSNGSVDVNKLVDSIASRSANDPAINLGSQTILESIFGVDNTHLMKEIQHLILKSLAEANILIQMQRQLMVSLQDVCCSG